MNDPARNPYTNKHHTPDFSNRESSFQAVVRTGQVITFALIIGIALTAAIMFVLTVGEDSPTDSSFLLPAVGASAGMVSWLVALVLPDRLRRQAGSKLASNVDRQVVDDDAREQSQKEFAVAQNRSTLIGQAVLEGGAMINLVLMFLDHWLVIHLSFAAAAIIGIASMTPTATRLRHAMEQAEL